MPPPPDRGSILSDVWSVHGAPGSRDSQGRPTRPGSRLLARESLLVPRHQASPPGQSRTVAEGCAAEGSPKAADGSLKLREAHLRRAAPFSAGGHAGARSEKRTSERGGGSSWRRPGTATTTPIVGVTPVAPTPRPASLP